MSFWITTWLAAVALPLALLAAGRFLVPPVAGESVGSRAVTGLLAGMVLLGLLLAAFTWCGLPWHPAGLLLGLAVAALLARRLTRRGAPLPAGPGWPADLDWGDAAALLGLAAFTRLAAAMWITTPDFVYHWGIKGERYFLARGIDWEFLARSWNEVTQPHYPHLLPSLWAATALLAGRFHPPALMLWSALFLALTVLAGREAWRAAGVGPAARQAGVAFLGLAVAAYAIGYLFAGGADLMIGLALAAALPPLLGSAGWGARAGLRLGIVAAFAAASKAEGLPLAAFLVGAFLLGVGRHGGSWRERGQAAAAAVLPPALAVLPWLAGVHRFGLFETRHHGPFDWSRAEGILPAMVEAAWTPELHGLPWLVLLLPLLAIWPGRRAGQVRLFTLAGTAQLLFYFLAYFTSTREPRMYVLTSFARLLYHLLAAIVAVVAVAAGTPREDRSAGTPRSARSS